jgi:hypothetical protein
MTRGAKRLDFSDGLRRMLEDIAQRVPEFAYIEPQRILITAGQARKKSRATTRPFSFGETGTRKSENGKLYKPIVKWHGRRVRYEITLRPLFFMRSSAAQRLRTIFHELYHLSQQFDGTLDASRRHDVLPRGDFDRLLRPMIRRYEKLAPAWVNALLAHNGEVLILQWLERPPHRYRPGAAVKRRYTHDDLFLGPVLMLTS